MKVVLEVADTKESSTFNMISQFVMLFSVQLKFCNLGRSKAGSPPPGVSILCYISISILIKYSNFSRFYKKNWVHFIKNSDVISLVIDQSQPKMH